ncbi:hypothetical protein CMT56_09110 [Elizabethkingia anophelis]|nr:hypothetical protein [Elizabethkingia anophelis]MDV3862465.1 hypothetical protein [Elizabethkingia anophelis]MDV3909210.1 hypothetical protein [Elizabethkingia anophelis]MDV3923386.1 hypothetical protein [Elizabethkingia anophelis]MDV3988170.1 hypothetical protein [Elizabethkingia anophelis]
MSKYDITHIPIKSAIKIFTFLDQFLEEENLNPKYLRVCLDDFSFEERYYLVKYALEYYSLETGSYLDRWLKNKVSLLGGYDECQLFINEIIENVKAIKNIFNFRQRAVIEKNFKVSEIIKKTNFSYMPAHGVEQKIKITIEKDLANVRPRRRIAINRKYRIFKRIPLYGIGNKLFEKYKLQFSEALKDCLDSTSIEELFYNTFEFHGNLHRLRFLNLKVGKKAQLEVAISILTKNYKETILDHLDINSYRKYNESIDEKHKSVSRVRKKFIAKKLGKPIEIQRIHFMRAMYNGFTYLREAYQKDLSKNSALDLDSFLRKRLKNTSNA